MSEITKPTEQIGAAGNQQNSDRFDLLQQVRVTLMAVKSVLDQTFELSQVRLFIFQEVQGAEEISQSEIHQKMGVDPAFITRIMKQMEAAGQITRRPDPADNRYTLVRMTESGQHQYQEMLAKITEIDSLLRQGLSAKDIRGLHACLERIRKNAEAQLLSAGNTPAAKAG